MSPEQRRRRRPDEVSAGGVVARPVGSDWEVALIRVGDAWSLPKGNVDPGETTEQAALREIAEEVGLPLGELRVVAPLPDSEYFYRRGGRLVLKVVHHYLVEAPGDSRLRRQESEIDESAWVPLGQASSRVAYRDVRSALAEAARLLGVAGGTAP